MKSGARIVRPRNTVRIILFLCVLAISLGIIFYFRGNTAQPETPVPMLMAGDHVLGERNAPVQLIVYTDLECPHCKALHLGTIARLQQEFGTSTFAIVYRHFPLAAHLRAPREAVAAECAAAQREEFFWRYVEQVFKETASDDALDPKRLPEIASELGLSRRDFEQCLDEPARMERVLHDISEGLRANVYMTPTIFVARKGQMSMVEGNYPLRLAITVEEMLRK